MKKKILIVDDSSIIRNFFQKMIEELDMEFLSATNGWEGIRKIKANRDIALMIADINMPGIDGLKMIEKIRKDEKITEVKILVLSTEVAVSHQELAKELDITAWVMKPFKPELLKAIIKKLTSE